MIIDNPFLISRFKSLLNDNEVLNPMNHLSDEEKSKILKTKMDAVKPDWLKSLLTDESFSKLWFDEA